MYRIARSILRDDSEAEDALQEAYVRAFTNLKAFRAEALLGTWLARIVINESLGRVGRRRPTVELSAIVEGAEPLRSFPSPTPTPSLIPKQLWLNVKSMHSLNALSTGFRTGSAPYW
jgi:RNA polymerase sigma-70 factor (ECF subfamily)